jgi:hypothetical protein
LKRGSRTEEAVKRFLGAGTPIQSAEACLRMSRSIFTESLILAQNERWRRV